MFLPAIETISARDLAARLSEPTAKSSLQLIDVREPEEIAIAAIGGFENLPLSHYADWSQDIRQRFDTAAETYVLCHHGIRSAQMCQWLQSQGFERVMNVAGGIDAWSVAVDPTVPRY